MPLRTLKYVVLELDTRTTELSMAVLSGLWGTWLVWSDHVASPTFWAALSKSGGSTFWGAWALIGCALQLFSIYYKYPKLRRFSCTLAIIYWFGIGWALMLIQPQLFVPWMAYYVALNHVWILAHRTAVTA